MLVEMLPAALDFLVFTGVVLLWARWSKLDLALTAPALNDAAIWIFLFIVWIAAEGVIDAAHPVTVDAAFLEEMAQFSFLETLVLTVVLAPIFEELLFRGAMFAALMRRWGILAAIIVPNLLWTLLHLQYGGWFLASIAGSGVILAIIRWKSGSLYPPLALHALSNLVATLSFHEMLGF